MKKGFTLIELLAVIVILAIISAIAIPIVIKVIDNVKISSLKISMSNIEKAIELYINKESINENKVFICSDGQCKDELNNKLEITGIVPEEGTINITPSGTITYNKLIIDGYLCDKYNKEFICQKASKNIEEVKEESIIIQNTSTNLSNYKIYGNSVQNGIPTLAIPTIVESVGENTLNLFNESYMSDKSNYSSIGSGYFSVAIQLKPNTTYTFNSKRTSKTDTPAASFWYKVTNRSNTTTGSHIGSYNASDGSYYFGKTTITTGDDGVLYVVYAGGLSNVYDYFTEFQMIEGSTATGYEPYGYYKIPVVAQGKNLFNTSKKGYSQGLNYTYLNDNSCEITTTGSIDSRSVEFAPFTVRKQTVYNWNFIINSSGDTNNLSHNRMYIWGRTGTSGSYTLITATPTLFGNLTNRLIRGSFNTKDYTQIKLSYYAATGGATDLVGYTATLTNIQLEYGTNATSFEPYYNETTNIYLKEPLRKVGNYVDYIDYKNQKEVRNVGVLNLNNEDNFELIDDYFVLSLENYPKKDKEISISNYLEYENNFWFDGNKLKLKIEGINTVEELHNWLSDKNIEIYYPLSKSIVSSVELPEINLNKNYSNIKVDTNIKPSNLLIEYN